MRLNDLQKLLHKTFGEDSDALDVAMYVLATMRINDAIVRGMATDAEEVTHVSPAELRIATRYKDGFVTNKFYLENYAPIKSALMVDAIKFESASKLMSYVGQHPHKNNEDILGHVKAILLSRVDVFTLIASLRYGVEYAEEFDAKLRSIHGLSPEHKVMFAKLER